MLSKKNKQPKKRGRKKGSENKVTINKKKKAILERKEVKNDKEKEEQKRNLYEQHMHTLNTAKTQPEGKIENIGPYLRKVFPLLKISKKENEFFLRCDSMRIERRFTDENNEVQKDFFFYPSNFLLTQFKENYKSDHGSWEYILFKRLQDDGEGSFIIPEKRKKKLMRKKAA